MDISRTSSTWPVGVKKDRSTHYRVAQSKNKFQIVVMGVRGLPLLLRILFFVCLFVFFFFSFRFSKVATTSLEKNARLLGGQKEVGS